MSLPIEKDVPLAAFCTLGLGGPARHFAEVGDEKTLGDRLSWAHDQALPVFILGGGSNLVVADEGFPGLVIRLMLRGLNDEPSMSGRASAPGDVVLLRAAAGEPWDPLVAGAVAQDLTGIECLSGIPGSVGATPMQNVGAYGQEVADTIHRVRVLDRQSLQVHELAAVECGFSYRDSMFRRAPDRYVVLAVTFALVQGGAPKILHDEVRGRVARLPGTPTVAAARAAVLALRAGKSMIIDAKDENRRSVGSFFTNPVIAEAQAEGIFAQAVREGLVRSPNEVPRTLVAPGKMRLSAAWLVERAGIAKGFRRGTVGVSSRHTLALVHHGGGTTAELLALARHVRDTVAARFGVTLTPEPTLLGVTL